jgi:hypothetical protein
VEPAADYTAEQVGSLWEDRLAEISEVIFIALRWDRTYQRLVEMAEQAGCHCTALVVGEPDQKTEDRRQTTEDGAARIRPFSVLCPPSSDCRFVSAEEVLAGRRDAV